MLSMECTFEEPDSGSTLVCTLTLNAYYYYYFIPLSLFRYFHRVIHQHSLRNGTEYYFQSPFLVLFKKCPDPVTKVACYRLENGDLRKIWSHGLPYSTNRSALLCQPPYLIYRGKYSNVIRVDLHTGDVESFPISVPSTQLVTFRIYSGSLFTLDFWERGRYSTQLIDFRNNQTVKMLPKLADGYLGFWEIRCRTSDLRSGIWAHKTLSNKTCDFDEFEYSIGTPNCSERSSLFGHFDCDPCDSVYTSDWHLVVNFKLLCASSPAQRMFYCSTLRLIYLLQGPKGVAIHRLQLNNPHNYPIHNASEEILFAVLCDQTAVLQLSYHIIVFLIQSGKEIQRFEVPHVGGIASYRLKGCSKEGIVLAGKTDILIMYRESKQSV